MRTIHILLVVFFSLFQLPALAAGPEIRMSVAASMTDVVRELAATYTRNHPDVSILVNRGSSGSLARQIVLGAPADIFISANSKWMQYLVQMGRTDGRTVRIFAANSLVFLGIPDLAVSSLNALPRLSRIALGSPESVPAGQYARQAMQAAGIYENLRAEHKLVKAKDVRQALLYADRGEVNGSFVYRTDALLAKHAVILFPVPASLHAQINYPLGLTPEGGSREAVRSLYAFLTGPVAATTLERFAFSIPPAAQAATN